MSENNDKGASADPDTTQADADKFAKAMIIASADSEGEIVSGDDGFYVYWPKGFGGGAFSAWVLRAIADELDRRNAAWDANVQAYHAAALRTRTGEGD